MSNTLPGRSGRSGFTYADYMTWPDDERWELIDGEAWNMSPAPSPSHQELSTAIVGRLWVFLKGKSCRPYHAPLDVILPKPGADPNKPESIDTIVQPDIAVVCDRSKITHRGVVGMPEVVMEILSPSTVMRDMNVKKELYARHGCREYWIWDAKLQWASRLVRQESGLWDEGTVFKEDDIAESIALPGFGLSMSELREEMGIRE